MWKFFLIALFSYAADVKDPILRPPQQTVATRPVCNVPYGCVAYNSELKVFEGFDGTSWEAFGVAGIVEDTLVSTSTINALSANQGRILDEKILLNTADIASANFAIGVNGVDIANNAADIASNTTAIAGLDGRIIPLEADTHTHANKLVLDSIPLVMCADGEILKSDGTNFLCVADSTVIEDWQPSTTYTAGTILVAPNKEILRVIVDHTSSTDLFNDYYADLSEVISPIPVTTGVVSGGVVTSVGGLISVTAGRGAVVSYSGTSPNIITVTWSDTTGIVPPNPTGANFVAVDDLGNVGIYGGGPLDDPSNKIILARVNPAINAVVDERTDLKDPLGQLRDLSLFLGSMVKGLSFLGNPDQTLAYSAHRIHDWGASWGTSTPNIITLAAKNPAPVDYYLRSGFRTGPQNLVETCCYDNGGVWTTLSQGNFGFVRIYQNINGDTALLYSQAWYQNLADAKVGASTADLIVPSDLVNSFRWVSYFAFRKDDTNLSLADIVNCGLFGCAEGGGGGGGGGGDVLGPVSAIDSNLAAFDGVSGKIIKDSGISPADVTHANKLLLDSLTSTGTGSQFLADDGTYKIQAPLTTWVQGKDYKAGEIVNTGSDGNWLFKVVQDHTSADVPADFRTGKIMAIAPPIITTGVQDGGEVSLAGNLATIQGGTGYIAKYGTSPSAWPLVTIVEWTTQNIIVPSTGIHALYIDATGNLILSAPTSDLEDILRSAQDDTISVAIVDMNLGLIYDRKTYPTNPVGQLRGLSFFFGVMTKGLSYTATGLQLSRSQHDVYFWGADPFNPYNPNQKTVPSLPIANFFEFQQNGAVLPAVRITTLKNTVYDNNGTLTAMTNNRWGFIRIYSSPGSDNYIMYSQGQWQTEAEAKAAAVSGSFIRPADLELTKFSAWFTFMKGDADFSDNEISVCEPFGCDKIGSTSAGGGGSAGDVLGPVSAVQDNIPTFADATGKVIKDSGIASSAITTLQTNSHTHTNKALLDTVKIYDNTASLTFDFNNGNTQYTTGSCGAVTLSNMMDGGTYQVIIRGATSGTCVFSHTGLTFRYAPANGVTTANTHSVYSMTRVGTIVYVSWITGF